MQTLSLISRHICSKNYFQINFVFIFLLFPPKLLHPRTVCSECGALYTVSCSTNQAKGCGRGRERRHESVCANFAVALFPDINCESLYGSEPGGSYAWRRVNTHIWITWNETWLNMNYLLGFPMTVMLCSSLLSAFMPAADRFHRSRSRSDSAINLMAYFNYRSLGGNRYTKRDTLKRGDASLRRRRRRGDLSG